MIYFFDDEIGYENWLSQNKANGFVVNNLTGGNPRPWKSEEEDGGLRLHKATCKRINDPNHRGVRTKPFGKLCGAKKQELILECENLVGKKPTECKARSSECFN